MLMLTWPTPLRMQECSMHVHWHKVAVVLLCALHCRVYSPALACKEHSVSTCVVLMQNAKVGALAQQVTVTLPAFNS